MIVEGPTIVKNKTVTAAVPHPTPTSIVESSVSQSVQESSKPLPILIRSNSATQASSAGSRSQDAILVGSSGIPLVIPTHFVHKGSQPILLQANQAGCLQVLGSGTQNMPVLGRAMVCKVIFNCDSYNILIEYIWPSITKYCFPEHEFGSST